MSFLTSCAVYGQCFFVTQIFRRTYYLDLKRDQEEFFFSTRKINGFGSMTEKRGREYEQNMNHTMSALKMGKTNFQFQYYSVVWHIFDRFISKVRHRSLEHDQIYFKPGIRFFHSTFLWLVFIYCLQYTTQTYCRSDAGIYPHRAHSAESRGLSFDSGPLEISRHKRLLSPPGSPNIPSGQTYASANNGRPISNRK